MFEMHDQSVTNRRSSLDKIIQFEQTSLAKSIKTEILSTQCKNEYQVTQNLSKSQTDVQQSPISSPKSNKLKLFSEQSLLSPTLSKLPRGSIVSMISPSVSCSDQIQGKIDDINE